MNIKTILMSVLSMGLLTACHHSSKPSEQVTSMPFINWQLSTTESGFSFISTKNSNHTEEHSIQFASGLVDDQGQMTLVLDLATVDTMIPIRDQRMRDILFEIEDHPVATISSQLDQSMPLLKAFEAKFNLDLHGVKKDMQAQVLIQSAGEQLVVTNYEPVSVNGKDFGLDPAINQLTKIAGLRSINYEVLVDFKLVFEKAAN
jgi:polyisoprenoid-binding protein YceI